MVTVKFNDKDSYKDWGLILKPKSRPLPVPKTTYVSIEGKDGDLDLTTSLTGDVKYQNVSYSLEFTLMDKRENWENKLYEISTYLHGKKMNVIFSDDPEWYCVGRVSLNELTSNKNLGVISLDCNFEPYRLKVSETVITEKIEVGKVITLSNSRKWVMPIFKLYGNQLVDFNGGELNTGTTKIFENDILTIIGDGSRTYQSWSKNITDLVKENAGEELYLDYENLVSSNDLGVLISQITIKYNDGTPTSYHSLINSRKQKLAYTIPQNVNNISSAVFGIYSNFNSAIANTLTITKPMFQFGTDKIEYESYIENLTVNFAFDGKEYSFSGKLKTPDIILKEGVSEITLNSEEGNIRISYKEGKL